MIKIHPIITGSDDAAAESIRQAFKNSALAGFIGEEILQVRSTDNSPPDQLAADHVENAYATELANRLAGRPMMRPDGMVYFDWEAPGIITPGDDYTWEEVRMMGRFLAFTRYTHGVRSGVWGVPRGRADRPAIRPEEVERAGRLFDAIRPDFVVPSTYPRDATNTENQERYRIRHAVRTLWRAIPRGVDLIPLFSPIGYPSGSPIYAVGVDQAKGWHLGAVEAGAEQVGWYCDGQGDEVATVLAVIGSVAESVAGVLEAA